MFLAASMLPLVQVNVVATGRVVPAQLETNLSSVGTHKGDAVSAVVRWPVTMPDGREMAAGVRLRGQVTSVNAVGMGLLRDRAHIDVEWTSAEWPGGETTPIRAQLAMVDNARENVSKHGRLRGIPAAGGFGGDMHCPFDKLAGMTPVGMAMNTARGVLMKWPDPEITLPRGTEMYLRMIDPLLVPPAYLRPNPYQSDDEVEFADRLPARTQDRKGRPADVTNVVLIGSKDDVRAAMEASGWRSADRLTAMTGWRTFRAVSAQRGYFSAPMSKQLLFERRPDMEFQKSFNSVAKRHHVRFWQLPGEPDVWVGAATHDTGIKFMVRRFQLTHGIDDAIDRERDKLVGDLRAAGCARDLMRVGRDLGVALDNASGQHLQTDGDAVLVRLQACESELRLEAPTARRARPITTIIREARNLMLRRSYGYWGYRIATALMERARHDVDLGLDVVVE